MLANLVFRSMLILAVVFAGETCNAEGQQPPRRIAIISAERSPFYERLRRAFGEHTALVPLEQDDVLRMLREHGLKPFARCDTGATVQLGLALSVDALLTLEPSSRPGDSPSIRVQLDDTRYGFRIFDLVVSLDDLEGTAKRLVLQVVDVLNKVKADPNSMLLICVTPFESKELSSTWDWLTKQIQRSIEQELNRGPDVIVLSRDFANFPPELRASLVLLDGEYHLEHGPREVVVKLVARNRGSELFAAEIRAPMNDSDALGREVARKFQENHRRPVPVRPFSDDGEAEYLAGMARASFVRYQAKTTGVRLEDLETAIIRVDVARALQPMQHEHTLLLLDLLNAKLSDLQQIQADSQEMAEALARVAEIGLRVWAGKTELPKSVAGAYEQRLLQTWSHYTNYARELRGSLINFELHLPRIGMDSDLSRVADNFYMYRNVCYARSRRSSAAALDRYMKSVNSMRNVHPLLQRLMNAHGEGSYLANHWLAEALPCIFQFADLDDIHDYYRKMMDNRALARGTRDKLGVLTCAIIDPWSAYYTWAPPIHHATQLQELQAGFDRFRQEVLKHEVASVRMAAELKEAFVQVDHDLARANDHFGRFERLLKDQSQYREEVREWIVQLILTAAGNEYLDQPSSKDQHKKMLESIENHQAFLTKSVSPNHREMHIVFLGWAQKVFTTNASAGDLSDRGLLADQMARCMVSYLGQRRDAGERTRDGWNRLMPNFVALLRSAGRGAAVDEILSTEKQPVSTPPAPTTSPEQLAKAKIEAEQRLKQKERDSDEIRKEHRRYAAHPCSEPMFDYLNRYLNGDPFKSISLRRLVSAGDQIGVLCTGSLPAEGDQYQYAMLRLDITADPPQAVSLNVLNVSTNAITKPKDYRRYWTYDNQHRQALKFATAGRDIFMSAPGVGIVVFPEKGEPELLSEDNGLASNEVGEIAVVAGKIYTQIGGIVSPDVGLMEVDLKKRCSRIVCSTRDESSGLEGRRLSGLAADPRSDKLWITTNGDKNGRPSLITYMPTGGKFEVIQEATPHAAADFRIVGRTANQLFLGGHSGRLWLCDMVSREFRYVFADGKLTNFPVGDCGLAVDGDTWLIDNSGSGVYLWRPGMSMPENISRACSPTTSIYTGISVTDWTQTRQGLFLITYVSSWSPSEGKNPKYDYVLSVIPTVRVGQ